MGGGGAEENFLRGEFGQEVDPVEAITAGERELRIMHDEYRSVERHSDYLSGILSGLTSL